MELLTQSVLEDNRIDEGTGAIRTPLVLANASAWPEDPSGISWSGTDVPPCTLNIGVN